MATPLTCHTYPNPGGQGLPSDVQSVQEGSQAMHTDPDSTATILKLKREISTKPTTKPSESD